MSAPVLVFTNPRRARKAGSPIPATILAQLTWLYQFSPHRFEQLLRHVHHSATASRWGNLSQQCQLKD